LRQVLAVHQLPLLMQKISRLIQLAMFKRGDTKLW
jgi:hypothetical protein